MLKFMQAIQEVLRYTMGNVFKHDPNSMTFQVSGSSVLIILYISYENK